MYVESHIHLSHALYDGEFPYIARSESGNEIVIDRGNREALIKGIKDVGIGFCVEPGIELWSNEKILEVCSRYPGFIYPAMGVHPTRTPDTRWKDRRIVERLSQDSRVVAIGELGLDYHYERKKQHRIKQKRWFVWQLKLAHKRKLPLILHIRMADKDAIRILRLYKNKLHGGVCHCFNGDKEIAKIYTEELGLMLGIGGGLLQKPERSADLVEAIKHTSLENIVLETDGPYVKPERPSGDITKKQWTKARNTSAIIPDVARKIAEIKGIDVEEVERVTTKNAKRLFEIA